MDKNRISIVLVSTGKNPSRYFNINLSFIKYGLSLFFSAFIFLSFSYFYPGDYNLFNYFFSDTSNSEVVAAEEAQTISEEKAGTSEFSEQFIEYEIESIESDVNVDGVKNRMIEVEQKLIDMQELLKKKGISKSLSVGGEFIPAEKSYEEYFDTIEKDIESLTKTLSLYPIGRPTLGSVSSSYGYRQDPFNKKRAFHSGIDLNTNFGSPVVSTADGLVERAGWCEGYGRCVILKHSYGYKTLYGHLSKISVKKGQKVKSGEIIGRVGSTGRSTGPHLHYEVIKNGKRINPKNLLTLG